MNSTQKCANTGAYARVLPLLLSFLLFMGGCVPQGVESAVTSTPQAEATATPTPTPQATHTTADSIDLLASRAQKWIYTKWSPEEGPGITRENSPKDIPVSVLEILPLVECALVMRTY